MTTRVEKQIVVEVPVGTAYNQWTQFEDFPQFMGGVKEVTQVTDDRLHWVVEIGGVKREWDATILEQVADQKVAWAATQGATNAGAVYFDDLGAGKTSVRLVLEYEPEGLVERAGDKLGIVERQAESDLKKFKGFIEGKGHSSGAWRGSVNEGRSVGTPGTEDAATSAGDSGKAGFAAKTVAAGAVAATVAAGVAAAAVKNKTSYDDLPADGRDVVDILTADHREVTEMIAEIWTTADAKRRRDLADMIITELVRHSVAEEMHVYPAMREYLPDGDQAVEHDTEEHKEIEQTLKDLEGLEASDPRFDELIQSLEATLRDHISDEEDDQFPQLRAQLPAEKLVELGSKVEAAKKLAPTRPHPSAPNSAPFHKIVGPGVGLVDRLRDKLSGRST